MNIFSVVYNDIFYKPLLNGLVFLINIIPLHDIGFAVILLTIVVRFILFPFSHRSIITQQKIKKIEPEINKIKSQFKDNSQEQSKKTMELYKQHGINPFSGCLTLILQLPVIFALYKVFTIGMKNFNQENLYYFISSPEIVNMNFLGLIDMSKSNYVLAFLAGASQFFQIKLSVPPIKKDKANPGSLKDNFARNMNIQMRYIMPVIVFFIALEFSSAIALYWTTMNVFAIIHETIVRKKAQKIYEQPDRNN
jgi:YidC/Oxa1 family membrane protein insertase